MKSFYYEDEIFYIPNNKISFKSIYEQHKSEKKNDDFIFININDANYKISKNSKFIEFNGNNVKKKFFISNSEQVFYLINLFKFKKFKVQRGDEILERITDKLQFDKIIEVDNYLEKKDFLEANKNIENN